jgi:sortase (surface protein transpeptidase)
MSIRRIYSRKWSFLALFVFVFLGSVNELGQLDLLPEISHASHLPTIVQSDSKSSITPIPTQPELPTKIEISKINLSTAILNPTSTDFTALDRELLKGVMRYPISAKLGEVGNVVLFGHSSYLPVVLNQSYKIFNGIQKLVDGDIITIYSSSTAYTYRVRGAVTKSTNDANIPLNVPGRVLTLVTSDSFDTKIYHRFIITADFVESRPLN